MKTTVVLGIGNPLMSDEGIGGFLISALAQKQESFPDVEFIDAGTGGLAILHLIAGRKKVVLIDCAFMNKPPGSIKRFTPEQVQSVKTLAHQSLHEMDILKVIEMAKQLDQAPAEIVIFGIEPVSVELGAEMSPVLKKNLPHYLELIEKELK